MFWRMDSRQKKMVKISFLVKRWEGVHVLTWPETGPDWPKSGVGATKDEEEDNEPQVHLHLLLLLLLLLLHCYHAFFSHWRSERGGDSYLLEWSSFLPSFFSSCFSCCCRCCGGTNISIRQISPVLSPATCRILCIPIQTISIKLYSVSVQILLWNSILCIHIPGQTNDIVYLLWNSVFKMYGQETCLQRIAYYRSFPTDLE